MLNLAGYKETNQVYTGTRTLVYQAIQETEGKPVIIKVLRSSYPNFNELVQFRNQYIITRHLEHPAIVQPLALERYGNGYALVMPDEGAIALGDYWQESKSCVTVFLHIAIQLASALHYLSQQRIIHKDIKPANILILPETKQVKLIDFSISSLLPKEEQQLINPNVLEGTLAYISPEQTGRMNRGIDYRSDFYSLGVTFFELLTGKLPFQSNDPMKQVHCHIAQPVKFPVESEVPEVLQKLVLKLMGKNAEDRYQSALGLKHDLEKCQQQLETTGKITSFTLAETDQSDRFIIPEKLYGREAEVQTLLDAFERVAIPPPVLEKGRVKSPPTALTKGRRVEMMLVAGFSGIGKTAVVNEVHKPIVRQQGYFIKGKYDQFNRNIPFSAFVQAFRDLMKQLLSESDTEIATWKTKILKVLGDNAQVIIEVVPELEKIIGQQPAAPELSGSAAQNRFNLLFQKFIAVFTALEHPVVMFLDDLQWADSASLNLMKVLMSNTETGYLLLLGAYRDNEVFPAHPLILTLGELEKNQAVISTITLQPLALHHINQLVADTLNCSQKLAQPLTELVYQKTKGNPFFTTQFLKGLYEDGLITFNRNSGYWECDLVKVRDAAITDDVVEFMAGRLQKLRAETQKVLKLAACIGNHFELETLAVVCEKSFEEVAEDIWGALQEGLILPISEAYKFFQGGVEEVTAEIVRVGYRFLHDRVQQAAYSLIPEEQKQRTHYRIGQLLLQQIPPEHREEKIFQLVSQLNYGTALITEQKQRDELAELNLIACRKAKASTAYQAGREYAKIGLSLLGENAWQRKYEMSLAFHDLAAELASLCSDFEAMEQFIETVITQAKSVLEQVHVCRIRIQAYASGNKLIEAIAIGLQLLEKLAINFPEEPTPNDIQQAMVEIDKLIGDREIENLIHLPTMIDAEKIAIVQVVNSIMGVVAISGSPLYPLLAALTVKLSIQYGNTSASAIAYVSYGLIACKIRQDVDRGVKFGQLAVEVVSKQNAKAIKPQLFIVMGLYILHRKSHIKETLLLLQEGYGVSLEVGNLEYVGYNAQTFCLNSFWCGQPLATLDQETRAYCNGLLQLNQLTTASWCRMYLQSILNLLGVAEHPSVLSGEVLQEAEFITQLLSAHDRLGLYFFHIYKLMLSYLFGEIESAQNHAVEVKRYWMAGAGTVCEPAFYFYDSLTVLATSNSRSVNTSEIFQKVEENQAKLQQHWAQHAPMNHQHKVDLVEAEICRLKGQKLEAIELYDRAIALAQENEYLQEEALANELAAKFYLEWGKEKIAATYMQEAYYCYSRWGAKAKTDQLETQYPQLLTPILKQRKIECNPFENLTQTLQSNTQCQTSSSTKLSETLDFASILQTAQALSSTIELDPLLTEIVEIILTNAGAKKTVLLIPQADQWQIQAMAEVTNDGKVETSTTSLPLTAAESIVPIPLIQYVKNTQKSILINESKTDIPGIFEGYLLKHQPESVLCIPLLYQGNLVAILYLEHPTTKGVFTSYRHTIVQFLCTQAAISLQNAQLYDRSTQALRDLKAAQLQIIQSEKMSTLGNLMAGVAHEINNPTGFLEGNIQPAEEYVRDLLGLIDLYQSEYPQPTEVIEEEIEVIELEFIREDLLKLLGSMNVGVERIRNISNSLRTFSRTDREHKTVFNIHEGIDSTLLILKHRTKADQQRPGIDIVRNYGEIPQVECFPGQLNQVFMNILANAIDTFDEASLGKSYSEIQDNPNRITIRTSQLDSHQIQIQIQDNGCGMKPEIKDRIFEHGFTTKDVGKGTGLGLAIAHQIVTEKHGGTITCDSILGKGTTFFIVLPIV